MRPIVTYRPAKFLKKGDTIAFFTDPVGGYKIEEVDFFQDYQEKWAVGLFFGQNGYTEYHPAHPVPVLT